MADPIDAFIALPESQQLTTLNQLAPSEQQALLGQVRQRKSAASPIPSGITASFSAPPTLKEKLVGMFTHPLNTMDAASTPMNRPRDASIPEMVGTDLYNVGAGATGVVRHPLDALGQMATGAYSAITDPVRTLRSFYQQGMTNGPQMGALTIGQGLAMPAVLEAASPATDAAMSAARRAARRGADIIAGTTPKVAKNLAESTQAANEAAATKAATVNAKLQADRAVELQKHFERTQAVRAQNEAAQGVQSRKVALDRGVQQLDTQIKQELVDTREKVQAQASANYNDVRAKYGEALQSAPTPEDAVRQGLLTPSNELSAAVQKAQAKIVGSTENIKLFKDILSKYPEEEPDTISYQGAEIPKGHPLYDVLVEGTTPTTADLPTVMGYEQEIGRTLARGRGQIPSDVYLALRSLQTDLQGVAQKMADAAGVGEEYASARDFYRRYMQTFRDAKSPIAKAIDSSPEPGQTVAKFQGKDKSGIEALAPYNSDLAARINTVRGYQAESKAIPSKAITLKAEPTLSPAPPPVLADVKKIGLGDIQAAKEASMASRAEGARKGVTAKVMSGTMSGLAAYDMMRSLLEGNFGRVGIDIGARTGLAAIQYGFARLLENPSVVRALTAPTASDIAAIPPDLRAAMPQIVQAAQSAGIKVSPALVASTPP